MASIGETSSSAAKKPIRLPTSPQSVACDAADRDACTPQLTGFTLAMSWIQVGARLSCMNAADMNVSGSITSVTAPIRPFGPDPTTTASKEHP